MTSLIEVLEKNELSIRYCQSYGRYFVYTAEGRMFDPPMNGSYKEVKRDLIEHFAVKVV